MISYACSDEERAEMLKAGISPEYIEKSCRIDGLDKHSAENFQETEQETPLEGDEERSTDKESTTKDEIDTDQSREKNHIYLMLGSAQGDLRINDLNTAGLQGSRADLSGNVMQVVYFHLFANEILAGVRHISLDIGGNLSTPIVYNLSSGQTANHYVAAYKLEGFGFSIGRKFDLPFSTALPHLTYMSGDASISLGPYKDLVTGTGDYLAIEFPFIWYYKQVLFGISPQYIVSGGSSNENVSVKLNSSFSLLLGVAF
jgi:hypothetical protein